MREYDPEAAGDVDVSSSEDDLAVMTTLPATSPPTHNNMGADAQTPGMDVDTRAAARVLVPSELGNGEGKVGRVVEVPQPPPNKHSVDGDGSVAAPAHKTPQPPPNKHSVDGDGDNAPAHKKPRRQKKKGGNSKRGS